MYFHSLKVSNCVYQKLTMKNQFKFAEYGMLNIPFIVNKTNGLFLFTKLHDVCYVGG
jgi:hypothetical protein